MKLLLMFTILISFTTKAVRFIDGQSTGNGGDVVVCSKGNQKSYRILDLYEVTELHFLEEALSKGKTTSEYIEEIIDQTGFSPYDKNRYEENSKNFLDRVKWGSGELIDIPDSEHTYIPPHCELRQIAINHLNGAITINKTLWNQLNELNKAVLILHELIYEDIILSGHGNSVVARQIVSYAIGDKSQNLQTYVKIFDSIQNQGIEKVKSTFRNSPFPRVKRASLEKILKEDEFDFATRNYTLSLSGTYSKFYIGALLARSHKSIVDNDFVISFYKSALADNSGDNYIYPVHKNAFYADLKYREINSDVYDLLIDSFNHEIRFDLFHSDYRQIVFPIVELLFENRNYLNHQGQVDELLTEFEKVLKIGSVVDPYFELMNHLASDFIFNANVTKKYLEYIERRTPVDTEFSSYYLYEFFIKRGQYLDEVFGLLEYLLASEKYSSYDNAVSAYEMVISFAKKYPLVKSYFEDELARQAVRLTGIPLLIKKVRDYYDVYDKELLEYHREKIIHSAYSEKDSWLRLKYIDFLLLEQNAPNDEVQNLVSYGIRFSRDGSDLTFEKHVTRLNDNFDSYTEQTHSILLLEMRKRTKRIDQMKLLINLYVNKDYTSEVKSYLEFIVVNHFDSSIRLLAKEALYK